MCLTAFSDEFRVSFSSHLYTKGVYSIGTATDVITKAKNPGALAGVFIVTT